VRVAEPTSYQGGSVFLRWWPAVMIGCAVAMYMLGGLHSIQWPTLLIVLALVHARWMPWQFTIRKDGLALAFPFGRRVFLPKASLTVRMETIGATALVGRHRRFGYLLMDRILYEPGRSILLRTAFSVLGYQVTERTG
jgi:hypothetical protein